MLALHYRVQVERNVEMPMRDGTILRADLFMPDGNGPFPALVQRTPYNKAFLPVVLNVDPVRAAGAGYVVVNQDTRGRYASDGTFYPFVAESNDSYDTVEWAAAQAWCSGKVGMLGASYVGANQLHAAAARPPHLGAIAPWITAADYHEGWTYQGGAFSLGFNLNWTYTRLAPDTLRRIGASTEALTGATDDLAHSYQRLPLGNVPELGSAAPYYLDWLEHPEDGPYWGAIRIADTYERIGVPAFHLGAWYDIFLGGTLRNYTGLTAAGNAHQQLVVGPWSHSVELSNLVGEVDFGLAANRYTFDLDAMLLSWFDRWLKDEPNGLDSAPSVSIFVMGANVWRTEREWPLSRALPTAYYLHSAGGANSLAGDGMLSTLQPNHEPPDVFLADPNHPVPTVGGSNCCYPAALPVGPYDQRSVEQRVDVLVYSTPPLDHDVEVTGPLEVVLYASTGAIDADFTVKLVDVAASGYARNLVDSILRGRYREGTDATRLLEVGRVYEFRIDLTATSNVFKAGHRIRLEIASSNFPRFDRNPQTGDPAALATALAPAIQSIHHDRAYPSRIVLPVVVSP
jgi:putative CocE/NonD family hydrolase